MGAMRTLRPVRAGLVCALAALAAPGGDAARADEAPEFEYVRDVRTVAGVVRSVLERTRDRDAVLFVFDTVTFDPPPGRSEFDEQYRFAEDLPAWTKALAEACPAPAAPEGDSTSDGTPDAGSRAVFVAATTSERPVRVGVGKWQALLGGELRRDWWDDRSFREFEPAHHALPRLLARTPGERKALVLVTGDVLPETWIRVPPFRGSGRDGAEPWRRKLRDRGAYWDEERVGSALAEARAPLLVVAPESRFGDFLPLTEIPDAPWASRPQAPPVSPLAAVVPPTPGGAPRVTIPEEALRQLKERLRAMGLSDEETRRILDGLRAGAALGGGDASWPFSSGEKCGRFLSTTPLWFPSYGQQKFFNADSPSAYGYWPFARAAAKAGGAFYMYPFPPSDWADACPRDASLVDALAPELVPQAEFARLRDGDEALAAMLEAQRIVLGATPWTDGSRGIMTQGGASSWCGFEPGNRVASRWRPREKPWDWFLDGARSPDSWKREGRKLVPVVEAYDRAIAVLAAAHEKLAAGTLAGTCRRSAANLRLARYWFEMSAFHLDALSIYLRELERFRPPEAGDGDVQITYTRAIRLSDCLDAYDGRTISFEQEKSYGHDDGRLPDDLLDFGAGHPAPWKPGLDGDGRVRGYQGYFLAVPPWDPNYRAKRDLDYVLFRLDSRLLRRALRMVDAARDVMAHEARTGWGWVVYYSEACTFVWVPVPPGDARGDRHGDPEDSPPPPAPPRTPSGGGGGPATPK